MKYQLKSIVSLINDTIELSSQYHSSQHLVLHSFLQQEPSKPFEWYLFNDFCIQPATEEDALSFTQPWKIPLCFVFENIDYDKEVIAPLFNTTIHPPLQSFYSSTSLGAPNMYILYKPPDQ